MRHSKLIGATAALMLAVPASAQKQSPAESVLGLQDALALAITDQPRIEAYVRDAQASEEAAFAERSLPDPQLTAGIQNYPVTGLNVPGDQVRDRTGFSGAGRAR